MPAKSTDLAGLNTLLNSKCGAPTKNLQTDMLLHLIVIAYPSQPHYHRPYWSRYVRLPLEPPRPHNNARHLWSSQWMLRRWPSGGFDFTLSRFMGGPACGGRFSSHAASARAGSVASIAFADAFGSLSSLAREVGADSGASLASSLGHISHIAMFASAAPLTRSIQQPSRVCAYLCTR